MADIIVTVEENTTEVTVNDPVSQIVVVNEGPAGLAGTTDHGLLTGLADDDHPQYHNDARGDARYYTQSQVNTALSGKENTGVAASLDAAHVAASDPHSQYILETEKASALGVATLDAGGKVPLTQLPSSIFIYKGTWNASTNTPSLSDGTGVSGWLYRVSVSGSQNLGSGSISFVVGDYVIYNSGGTWEKSDTTDAVATVNGFTGNVVLSTTDISEGTNLYFTNGRAQSAMTGAISTVTTSNLGAQVVVVTDISGKIDDSTVTTNELNTLIGITSNIQNQLDGKEPTIAASTTAKYWRGDKTWRILDKYAVGLDQVDNTSDTAKPISDATQVALNEKIDNITSIINALIFG